MQEYVLGFAFDEKYHNVLLINKKRPAWQAGFTNGIGGKIEHLEQPLDAMVREFREETGIESEVFDWTISTIMHGPDWNVFVFFTNKLDIDKQQSLTDEIVTKHNVHGVLTFRNNSLSNIPWLISFILDKDFQSGKLPHLIVGYP